MSHQNEIELRDTLQKYNEKIQLLQRMMNDKEKEYDNLKREKEKEIKSVTEIELEYRLKEEDLRKQKK